MAALIGSVGPAGPMSAFNYTLDYRHHHLTWHEDDAVCGEPSAVRLVTSDGRFVMALPQGGSRRALRLVPASATFTRK